VLAVPRVLKQSEAALETGAQDGGCSLEADSNSGRQAPAEENIVEEEAQMGVQADQVQEAETVHEGVAEESESEDDIIIHSDAGHDHSLMVLSIASAMAGSRAHMDYRRMWPSLLARGGHAQEAEGGEDEHEDEDEVESCDDTASEDGCAEAFNASVADFVEWPRRSKPGESALLRRSVGVANEDLIIAECFESVLEFLAASQLGTSARGVSRRWGCWAEGAARGRIRAVESSVRLRAARSRAFADFGLASWQSELWECERLERHQAGLSRFTARPAGTQAQRTASLCEACRVGDLPRLWALLQTGVDLNAMGACLYEDGIWVDSPLGHAVAGVGAYQLRAARLLVRYGAEVDLLADYGSTPMHNAAQQGNLEMVKFLYLVGSDLNLPGHHGRTALDWTSGEHHPTYDGAEERRVAVAAFLRSKGGRGGISADSAAAL